MKHIYISDMKNKKDQKNIEMILKAIISSTKEKAKNEACLKLLDLFENSLDVKINFDYLLQSIEDLLICENSHCKKTWLQVKFILLIIILLVSN